MTAEDIRRFLLGDMPEEERFAFEQRLLSDAELSDRVAAEERDLLDEHVRGELPHETSERIQALYTSSPSGRAKLDTARALQGRPEAGSRGETADPVEPSKPLPFRSSEPAPPPRRRPWRIAAGLLAASLALVLVWTVSERVDGPQPDHLVARIDLNPIRTRNEAPEASLLVAPEIESLKIVIDLETVSATGPFRAHLEGPGGESVWNGEVTAEDFEWGRGVTLFVPALDLVSGAYTVQLFFGEAEEVTARFLLRRPEAP